MRASAGALSAAMVLGSVTVAPAVKAENVEEKAGYEVNYALNSKVTASIRNWQISGDRRKR